MTTVKHSTHKAGGAARGGVVAGLTVPGIAATVYETMVPIIGELGAILAAAVASGVWAGLCAYVGAYIAPRNEEVID